ncbi:MAG TPA: polysaccharide biosynthesis tyrosine autokinase [Flavobacteriaceae bacterium]|nr:polysaccharide biosynthesis tyrosine autokinase [Flavobacteriaceae bacterium]
MQTTQQESKNHENYIIELFKKVLPYKWSIIFITLLAIVWAKYQLYFITSTYESYAVIKVKSNHNQFKTNDLLRDSLNNNSNVGIKQEILSLKTFKTNKETLEKVNFTVQYFKKTDYRMIELYNKSPICLELNDEVSISLLHAKIEVRLRGKGFTLKTQKSAESEIYPFDEEIESSYFTGTISKKDSFSSIIYIVLNGNSRQIYENIVKKRLRISQIDKGANLIRVAFQDTIPERANNYVNTLVQAYITQSLQTKDKTNRKVLSFLDLQLETIKKKLEKSENELEQYKTINSVEPSVKSKDSFDKLSTIDLELSEITLKDKLAKNLIIFINSNRNLDPIAPTLLEFNDQATIKFIDTLEEMQQKEDVMTLDFTDEYPELKNLRKSMKRIKRKILLNVKSLKSTLVTKRTNLEQQKKKYENILKNLPKKEKKLIHFKRDYEVNSKMYTYLLEKKSENELIKVASVSNYEIIDQAYTPSRPIKPKRLIFLITTTIIGFILALFIALLRSSLITKGTTHKDIKLITKLPIYGTIPLYKNAMFSTIKLKEAYHQLATNLQFSKQEHQGSIVLISSSSQGEGKTTTVVNLAGVFQNSGYKTVVLDLNMRTPSLHGHFGIEQQYSGISTYLSQRDNIGNIIFSTNYQNLDIIPSGPIPPNPSELILSNRLLQLFEILKKKYDYILIDTADYTSALETLYLMQFTSMNLIVLREKMSKKESIPELEKIIQEKNLQNIGLVLKSIVKEDKHNKNDLLMPHPISHELKTPKHIPIQIHL